MYGSKGHMMGGRHMMSEKMMEMMSKEDLMMMYALKLDKKIAIMEVKLEYLKKMRDMLKEKM